MASLDELMMLAQAQQRPNPAVNTVNAVLQGAMQGFQGAKAHSAHAIEREMKILEIAEKREKMKQMQEERNMRQAFLSQIGGRDTTPTVDGTPAHTHGSAFMRAVDMGRVEPGGDFRPTVQNAAPKSQVTDAEVEMTLPASGGVGFSVKRNKPVEYQKAEYLDSQGRARIGRWNPKAGKIEQGEDDPFASGRERGTIANDLRKEFIDRPEVKEYVTVSTQVKSMDAMLSNALNGNLKNQLALDQALITMYNKLTDPNSVVRESEYARTPENLPIINRISGAIEKIGKGGAGLTNSDREALVLGAKIIANERGGVFSQRRNEYNVLSKKYEIDPTMVTGTLQDFQPYEIPSPQSPDEGTGPSDDQAAIIWVRENPNDPRAAEILQLIGAR
ncbi:MAG: hypothetical protein HY548_08095 [Elusimicrobia bacterium]|nr:hypothetical protein [Elusimicrobiota bacterium]